MLSGIDLREFCNILEIPLGTLHADKELWEKKHRRGMQRKKETLLTDFISGRWRDTSVARTSTELYISTKYHRAGSNTDVPLTLMRKKTTDQEQQLGKHCMYALIY